MAFGDRNAGGSRVCGTAAGSISVLRGLMKVWKDAIPVDAGWNPRAIFCSLKTRQRWPQTIVLTGHFDTVPLSTIMATLASLALHPEALARSDDCRA